MADTTKANGGSTNGQGAAAQGSGPQVRVMGQYIKDLSFENPNVAKLINGPGDNPNLNVDINVGVTRIAPDVFESAINFKGVAQNKLGIIYDLEVVYGGLFKIENMPEPALEQTLLIACPSLLFPYLRRLVGDLTREGGFPPLLLDPIDFGALYVARQQQMAQGGAPIAKA